MGHYLVVGQLRKDFLVASLTSQMFSQIFVVKARIQYLVLPDIRSTDNPTGYPISSQEPRGKESMSCKIIPQLRFHTRFFLAMIIIKPINEFDEMLIHCRV